MSGIVFTMIRYRGGSKTACTADERLCFRYMDRTISLLPKFDRLCLICPERPKAGFLVARPISFIVFLLFMFLFQVVPVSGTWIFSRHNDSQQFRSSDF